jgi:formylglycine-generating enzyme required for sulfatase activity
LGVDKDVDASDIINGYRDGKPYDDGFPYTAPVGSFPPTSDGLYDLAGNVSEWIVEDFSQQSGWQLPVVRGGNWNTSGKRDLLASSREAVRLGRKPNGLYGFRCVIATIPPKAKLVPDTQEKPAEQ